jgi:hypothetical protein
VRHGLQLPPKCARADSIRLAIEVCLNTGFKLTKIKVIGPKPHSPVVDVLIHFLYTFVFSLFLSRFNNSRFRDHFGCPKCPFSYKNLFFTYVELFRTDKTTSLLYLSGGFFCASWTPTPASRLNPVSRRSLSQYRF